MKKTTLLMFSLSWLLLATAPARAVPQLSLGSANIDQGGSGVIDLRLSGGDQPYAGMNAKIILPPGVHVSDVMPGALLPLGFALSWRNVSEASGDVLSMIAYSGTMVRWTLAYH